MRIDLDGKQAVVSGSSTGIGFAIARGLAEAGAAVVINGRSANTTEAAMRRLIDVLPGAKVDGVAADLSTAEGVARLVERDAETDILVNNLGVFEPKPFEGLPTMIGIGSLTSTC